MNECFLVEETVPVSLTFCDILQHSVTYMVEFVKLTSHGSFGSSSLGPGLQLGRLSPRWSDKDLKRLFQTARFFHSPFEQGF